MIFWGVTPASNDYKPCMASTGQLTCIRTRDLANIVQRENCQLFISLSDTPSPIVGVLNPFILSQSRHKLEVDARAFAKLVLPMLGQTFG